MSGAKIKKNQRESFGSRESKCPTDIGQLSFNMLLVCSTKPKIGDGMYNGSVDK